MAHESNEPGFEPQCLRWGPVFAWAAVRAGTRGFGGVTKKRPHVANVGRHRGNPGGRGERSSGPVSVLRQSFLDRDVDLRAVRLAGEVESLFVPSVNSPRSAFRNRDAAPLVWISRRIAA